MAELKPETVVEPKETVEVSNAETKTLSEAGVVEKARKGEELSDDEREIIKAIPVGGKPEEETEVVEEEAEAEDEPKKEEPKQTSAPTVTEERRQLIEQELNKPDNMVDLSKFNSPVELGLYWDLRKAKKRNAKLQEENEILRIEKIVKELQSKPKETAEEDDPLAGREDEDILTVADVKKLLAKQKPSSSKPEPLRTVDQIRVEKVEADSRLRSKGITDFHDVVEFAEQVLGNDQEAIAILQDTARSGGNVAEKTYWLIKGHPAWPKVSEVIEQEKQRLNPKKEPPKENVERAERITKNEGKIKTTGVGTGSTTSVKEYTLADITNMTASEVRKLPKETRAAILKKFGSTPNNSI